ncbi:MAG TPA: biotin/lipoyl-containing protein, partial [Acidisoma sp.]|uniref:biotin/lipoyl-containing protein n=1 Tax=Acidisoma sp. TaxID=1872115 RepID=UPI002C67CFB5
LSGWAVEARIYAEDPARGFLPSSGRIDIFRPPAETIAQGVTVRVDTGLVEGGSVPIHYDPMIAKLITHAPTRSEAIAAQAEALDRFAIGGVRHNLSFLSQLMALPRWQEGRLSTGLIVEEFGEAAEEVPPDAALAPRLVAIVAANAHRRAAARQARPGRAGAADAARVVVLGGQDWPVETRGTADGAVAVMFADGARLVVESGWQAPDPVWTGAVDGQAMSLQIGRAGDGQALRHGGTVTTAQVWAPRTLELSRLMPQGVRVLEGSLLRAPMPGVLARLLVADGDAVPAEAPLVVIEAMKMEMVLKSPVAGRVTEIRAQAGDMLASDAPILRILPLGG